LSAIARNGSLVEKIFNAPAYRWVSTTSSFDHELCFGWARLTVQS